MGDKEPPKEQPATEVPVFDKPADKCIYCLRKDVVKRGTRKNKNETVQRIPSDHQSSRRT